jgi:hypothetical protein
MSGEAGPRYDGDDLAVAIRMKHDGGRLYMLAEVRDDLIYGVDTPAWAPTAAPGRARPYWDSRGAGEDWGWWGDSVELGICANMDGGYERFPFTGPADADRPGECWKVQGNASYGRLMTGPVLAGWAEAGHMRCVIRRTAAGYRQEWSIAFDPCLATGPRAFYEPGRSGAMGFGLLVLDLDRRADGAGHWSNIHHQAVYWKPTDAGKKARANWARLVLEPVR